MPNPPNDTIKTPVPDLNDLLAEAGVTGIAATDTNPSQEPPTPTEAKPDGTYLGAFRAGDGRWLHKYVDSSSRDGFSILPKKVEEMTDEDFMATAMSVSDPVSNRIPLNLTVKWRDAHIAGYWGNRKAQDGRSVRRLQSLGFTVAHKEDCEWIPQGVNTEDGEITDGDLVLMKIPKLKLFSGFLAGYFQEALQKGGKASYMREAQGALGGPTNKVAHYTTVQTANEATGLGPLGMPMAR